MRLKTQSTLAALIFCAIVFTILSPPNLRSQGIFGKSRSSPEPLNSKGVYVQEQNSDYRQAMQKIQQHIENDKNENFKNMLLWKHIDKMEEDIRRAAEAMAKMNQLTQYVNMIQGGRKDSSWNYEKTQAPSDSVDPITDADGMSIKIDKEYISIKESKVTVPELLMEPPVWIPPKNTSSHRSHSSWGNIIKVASPANPSTSFENMLREISSNCLPDEAIKKFSPQKASAWLMQRAGIKQKGSGIISRPAAPQDEVFRRFANLGSSDMEQTLFWSDTIVVDGYTPLLGTALNQTMLKGFKSVDMDNAVSQGKSGDIDRQNRILPPNRQFANPFRGAASRTVPGLVIMSQQGRLTDGEPITNEQLADASRLSKKLQLLPSQKMNNFAKNTNFKFSYPVFIIRVQPAQNTDVVPLPELELETYKRSMMMARDRLIDVQRLKNANRLSRQYINEIIEKLKQVAAEANAVAAFIQGLRDNGFSILNRGDLVGDSPDGAIPEITQLRQQILADIEYHRTVLSKLEHQHDDLRQKEWLLLEHILDVRQKGVKYLMNNASVRDNTEDFKGDGTTPPL